jgi:transcriptional regulator with XRE-family HTH domain
MKVLGAYLRDKRKDLNLSIQDMADKLNLAYSTVANMETGTKNPTLEQLRQYGLIFGCEWTQIINDVMNNCDKAIKTVDTEIHEAIDATGYDGADYNIANQDWEKAEKEFNEFESYFKEINTEYEQELAAEDLKINNDIEAAINVYIKRWTTKDTPAINQKDITDFRDEILHLIRLRAQHLTSK